MALNPNTRLGPYEILAPLGAGGMGEVYRALDTRLNREVAIKVLPEHLADDPERRQRLKREAQAVSSLNHPHICTLHDVGQEQGIHYLVMEYLEGETLSTRVEKGALPFEEAIRYAGQIADALDKAHRRGVIHRDLKPGNIMLTRSGAKLLDFGLAKQTTEAGGPTLSSMALTQSSPLTADGTVVGTFQYMSPEQLEGQEVDARTDLFAFGAVLYEMFTGRRAFDGKSQASLIAAIMEREPPSIASLQPTIPPALDRLVTRCLAKNPEERWQSAADLTSELKWIAEAGSQAGVAAPVAAHRRARSRFAWVVAGVAVLIAMTSLVFLVLQQMGEKPRTIRSSILPPPESRFELSSPVVLSPDGSQLALVAPNDQSNRMIWVRSLDQVEAIALPGTEGADYPFWSPDGEFLAFFSGGKLKKVQASGGPPISLCSAFDGRGGTWSPEGVIVFEPRFSDSLYRIPAGGGTPEPVTELSEERHEISHRWPHFLPDGRRFLFLALSTTMPERSELTGIYVGSLDSKETELLLSVQSRMAYADGYLFFRREMTLLARPFDPESLKFTGEAIPMAADLTGGVWSWGGAQFSIAEGGLLAYHSGGSLVLNTELVWQDRSGKHLGSVGEQGTYWNPRLSHDGRRLAMAVGGSTISEFDIWIHDLDRDVRTRLTFAGVDTDSPIWSPDDREIMFESNRESMGTIYRKVSTGSEDEKLLFEPENSNANTPTDWSPDGRFVLFQNVNKGTGFDIWTHDLAEEKKSAFAVDTNDQRDARFSPDGKWVIYTSNESGRNEIYVRSFPAGGGKWQISGGGGAGATWRADGKEIFYLAPDGQIMAVDVKTESGFEAGGPKALFEAGTEELGEQVYDVSADGQRFIVNTSSQSGRGSTIPVTLVTNWKATLK